ncbi:MAG: hypothetical protein ACKVP0_19695 [Pirellulaceae bacterium]
MPILWLTWEIAVGGIASAIAELRLLFRPILETPYSAKNPVADKGNDEDFYEEIVGGTPTALRGRDDGR